LKNEYREIFDARGRHYNLANRRFPLARSEEAATILEHLELSRTDRRPWLDLAAGGGYLAERARAGNVGGPTVACDESFSFLAESQVYQMRTVGFFEGLPFASGSFAGAGCLAALHHEEEPHVLVREMIRVTAPGSRLAVGDVAAGSPAASFLNGFVDRHTETGHVGRFYSAKSLADFFRSAGGHAIRSEEVDLAWRFQSAGDAEEFCRELFGLNAATSSGDLRSGLESLGLRRMGNDYGIPWRMVFASARA
jgi:SAM-dependent methyltransferase